jgi:type I restriction enzyme, S subunit
MASFTKKREGYKKTELGWIPEDWEVVKIGDVISLKSGSFLPKKDIVKGDYPVYGGNGIIYYHNKYLFENPKIIIGRVGANCGCIYITENYSWVTDNALYVNMKIKNFNLCFLFYLLNKLNLNSYANKNAQPVISNEKIYPILIAFPQIQEQQKIAAILSTVDEKIDVIDAEINAIKKLKKALMRQLLTRGIGHTEFKETELGLIPKEWEAVKLDAITEINSNSLSNNTDANYEIKYIDISSISCPGKISNLSSHKFCNAPSRARRIVKNGDIILSTVRPNLKAFAVIQSNLKNLICSTGFAVLRAKSSAFNLYIYQCLLSDITMNQITSFLVGSNYPAINSSDVKNICIPLPSLAEQKKIADILSTVDEKLDILREKKETYQTLKKGLMQQLLTGALRVANIHLNQETRA